ncbi:MAG: NADH-quinone oxidoreductase subunit K [Planctomycetes bacterium]|nr:NADH-quinone oxidoreductase subunit K [Planctomycetota bacterium]
MQQVANYMYYAGGGGLILIGLYMVLAKTNLVKIILGLSFLDTGTHVLLVAIGYVRGRTAPIFSEGMSPETTKVVDPVPQALVLTAIVIGVGVLALALALAIQVYRHYGTLDVRKIKGLKW